MTAVMVGYYVFAVGLIYAVGYFTYRQTSRELTKQTDEMMARMREQFGHTPPLPPYVPEPLPDDEGVDDAGDEEDADTLAAVREQLAELGDRGYPVAAALREVDELARRVGV